MSIAKNDFKLETQLDQLTLPDNSKYLEEILDDALITAMKGDQKVFCLKIETCLNEFMKASKNTDKLLNLDKFQRKIVHKICDLFFIKREYVDVKSDDKGDITITKTEQSKIPERSLEGSYKRYVEDRSRATTKVAQTLTGSNPQKILIKKKDGGPFAGFSIAKKDSKIDPNGKGKDVPELSDEAKEDSELEKRKLEYEQAKNRIFDTTGETQQTPSDQKSQTKKKSINTNECYDPAFDRVKGANQILQQKMKTNSDNTLVDPNLGVYPMIFPQLGAPMNPYVNYQMNPFPQLIMSQYPVGGPGNMMGGYPYPMASVGGGYPQNNTGYNQNQNQNMKPNPPLKKSSKEY